MNKGKRRKVGFAPVEGGLIETDGERSRKIPKGTSGGQTWVQDNIWERLCEKIERGERITGEKF